MPDQAVGDDLVDSVVSDSIPILTEQEKFNEAIASIVKRVEARLTGVQVHPPCPLPAHKLGWASSALAPGCPQARRQDDGCIGRGSPSSRPCTLTGLEAGIGFALQRRAPRQCTGLQHACCKQWH